MDLEWERREKSENRLRGFQPIDLGLLWCDKHVIFTGKQLAEAKSRELGIKKNELSF